MIEVVNLGFIKGSQMFSVNGKEVSTGSKGNFRKLCRKLVKEGYNPQEKVQLYTKGGTVCWDMERDLIEWAEELQSEGDWTGFSKVKPYPQAEWSFSVDTYGQK